MTRMRKVKIGVAAVQGAVSEHIDAFRKALKGLGVEGDAVPVRSLEEFSRVDAVVLPGGESTAISRLLERSGMRPELGRRAAEEDMPIMGTCAGLILMAQKGDEQVERTQTRQLGLLSVSVDRNAFGRQRESFESPLSVELPGARWVRPFTGIFIRAPAVTKVWGDCAVLARHADKVVAVAQGRRLGLAFHPELSEDLRFHIHFLELVIAGK